MAYREVTMLEVKEVLRLWLGSVPKKHIAVQLGLDVKTVRRYIGAAWTAGLRRKVGPEALDDGLLATVVGTVQPGTGRLCLPFNPCQRSPHSEPPGSGKQSHPGAAKLSQAGSPMLSHPGAAMLSHQLAVYKRTGPRPRLRTMDRLVWVGLARVWTGWRQALVIVSPDTVLRWQRRRFREHWTRRSGRPRPGRPPINAETAALIRTMAATNPLWGAPRIHGELLKLGIDFAERTVSRLMPKRCTPPSQT
jgi:hypothetical protein